MTTTLQFLGANRQVTGSRYLVTAAGKKILVDCGMFQEREFLARNWENPPFEPAELDAVLLTHVHIDHCGLLPRLVRYGFKGPIYMTRPSAALADVVLRDAAKIQEEDAAYKRKRHRREKRTGKFPEEPLYTTEDAVRTLPLIETVPYRRPVELGPDLNVEFHDAGHILGSAMLRLRTGTDPERVLLFSGDVGQPGKPLIRDPSHFSLADWVVMESTYGDRDHERAGDIETQLGDVINRTVGRGGNLVIPTFAVERAQELMYYIGRLVHADRIPDMHVFLDSPMAVDVTALFRQFPDCFDTETWELINSKEPPLRFPGLTMARSVAQSRAINEHRFPCIIMATSGMCNAGRIKHHLRHNIGRPESTVLFVGYQAHNTLGRHIVEGKNPIRIHGEQYPVRAEIARIYGLSGHADRQGLLAWLGALESPPRDVFLTHGEEQAALALQAEIEQRWDWKVRVPRYQETVELD